MIAGKPITLSRHPRLAILPHHQTPTVPKHNVPLGIFIITYLRAATMAVGQTNGTSNGSSNGHQNNGVGFDVRGLTPAPVTPFTEDGAVDYDAIQRLGAWLGGIDGVKGLVVLGHAGEGTFLTQQEQVDVIKAFIRSVDDRIPIIAGITGEGTEVAAEEAKRAKEAGAKAGLLYPSHGWLRFGYQPGQWSWDVLVLDGRLADRFTQALLKTAIAGSTSTAACL